MSALDDLKTYLENEIVCQSYGDYDGIAKLTMERLGAIRTLTEAAICEHMRKAMLPNGEES